MTVLIGGRECPINSSNSTGGVLVCVVPMAVNKGVVAVTISRSGESPHNVGMYTYAVPMVTGVFPDRSPTKGGSVVYVIGVNLNIGNVDKIRIYIVFSSTRKRRTTRLSLTNVM